MYAESVASVSGSWNASPPSTMGSGTPGSPIELDTESESESDNENIEVVVKVEDVTEVVDLTVEDVAFARKLSDSEGELLSACRCSSVVRVVPFLGIACWCS